MFGLRSWHENASSRCFPDHPNNYQSRGSPPVNQSPKAEIKPLQVKLVNTVLVTPLLKGVPGKTEVNLAKIPFTYQDAFQIDPQLGSRIAVDNQLCQLWHVMPSVAFACDVEVPAFVLWEALEPVEQEHVIIVGCNAITRPKL